MNCIKYAPLLFTLPFFQTAFASDNLDYCRDLMVQVRNTFGKSPFCVPVIDKNGTNMTEISGLVGMSDDMDPNHAYFFMSIIPGQLKGNYSYSEVELNSLIALIQYQGRGVTKNDGAIINLKNSIKNLDQSLKDGVITKNFHDNAVANLTKGIKDLQN